MWIHFRFQETVNFILRLHHKFIIVDIHTKNSPVSMMFYNAVRMPIFKKKVPLAISLSQRIPDVK